MKTMLNTPPEHLSAMTAPVLLVACVFAVAIPINRALSAVQVIEADGQVLVENPHYRIWFDPDEQGGLPHRVEWMGTGKERELTWHDRWQRLRTADHHPEEAEDSIVEATADRWLLRMLSSYRFAYGPSETIRIREGVSSAIEIDTAPEEGFDRLVRVEIAPPEASPVGGVQPKGKATYVFGFDESPMVHVWCELSMADPAGWSHLHWGALEVGGSPFERWAVDLPAPLANEDDLRFFEGERDRPSQLPVPETGGQMSVSSLRAGLRWVAWHGQENAIAVLRRGRMSNSGGFSENYPFIQDRGRTLQAVRLTPWDGESRQLYMGLWLGGLADSSLRQPLDAAWKNLRPLSANHPIFDDEPQESPPSETETYSVAGRTLNLVHLPGGIKWQSLKTPTSGENLLAESSSLFEVVWRVSDDHYIEVDSAAGWQSTHVETTADGGLTISFSEPDDPLLQGSEVRVRFFEGSETDTEHAIHGLIDVCAGDNVSTWLVRFPTIVIKPYGELPRTLHFPSSQGIRHDRPFTDPVDLWVHGPANSMSIQWFGLQSRDHTLSFETRDISASRRDNMVRTRPLDRTLEVAIDWAVEDPLRKSNQFSSPGPFVIRETEGDWYDAVQAYRDWVYEKTPFVPRKAPERVRNISFWMRSWTRDWDADWQAITDPADVNVGMSFYAWSVYPHDDYWPKFFPFKAGALQQVRKWQRMGYEVMPYLNQFMVDTGTIAFEEAYFKDVTKDIAGAYIPRRFGDREQTFLCPATETLPRLTRELARGMVERGIHGIYFDLVSGYPPLACFSEDHDHPPGFGRWWVQHHRDAVNQARDALNEDGHDEVYFISEYPSESFVGAYDGFLTITYERRPYTTPIFSAVFDGKPILFAHHHNYSRLGRYWRWFGAKELNEGRQLGWFRPHEWPEDEAAQAYYWKCAQLHDRLRNYFVDGQFGPPVVESTNWMTLYTSRRDRAAPVPHIIGSSWKKPDSAVVILNNVRNEPSQATVRLDRQRLGMPAKASHQTRVLSGQKPHAWKIDDVFELELEANEILVVEYQW